MIASTDDDRSSELDMEVSDPRFDVEGRNKSILKLSDLDRLLGLPQSSADFVITPSTNEETNEGTNDSQAWFISENPQLQHFVLEFIKGRHGSQPTQTPAGSTPHKHRSTGNRITKRKDYRPSANKKATKMNNNNNTSRDEEDEGQKGGSGQVIAETGGQSSLLWACPHMLGNTNGHFNCIIAKLTSFSFWAQHVRRKHVCEVLIYCGTCFELFPSETDRDQHQRQRTCQPRPRGADMIYLAEFEAIVNTTGISHEEKWFMVWRRLYPSFLPEPSSPYMKRTIVFLQQTFATQQANAEPIQMANAPASTVPGESRVGDEQAPDSTGLDINQSFAPGAAADAQLGSGMMISQGDDPSQYPTFGTQQFDEFLGTQTLDEFLGYPYQPNPNDLWDTPQDPGTVAGFVNQDIGLARDPLDEVQANVGALYTDPSILLPDNYQETGPLDSHMCFTAGDDQHDDDEE